MSRNYSNKTVVDMARFIDGRFSHTEIDTLFFSVSVPDGFDFGGSKLARSLSVLRRLSRSGEADPKILDELFNEVIRLKRRAFEPPRYSSGSPDELAASLKRALKADGYDVVEGTIVASDKLEFELASETSVLESKLQRHGMGDVAKTLDQAHQSFIEGRFEACNATHFT